MFASLKQRPRRGLLPPPLDLSGIHKKHQKRQIEAHDDSTEAPFPETPVTPSVTPSGIQPVVNNPAVTAAPSTTQSAPTALASVSGQTTLVAMVSLCLPFDIPARYGLGIRLLMPVQPNPTTIAAADNTIQAPPARAISAPMAYGLIAVGALGKYQTAELGRFRLGTVH
jgi:hypothetical protein